MGQEQGFKVSDCLYTPMMAINKTRLDMLMHSEGGNSETGEGEGPCVCLCKSIGN